MRGANTNSSYRRAAGVLFLGFPFAAAAIALILGAAPAAAQNQKPDISQQARDQIQRMMDDKATWTPAQRKINSKLLYESRARRGDPAMVGMPALRSGIAVEPDGTVLVDIKADVSDGLLRQIEQYGGTVINSFPQYRAIRARMPLNNLEDLAASADVQSIRPADIAITNKINTTQGDIAHRADQVRATFGIDGTGKRACALSDGVDALATVQASGDLPSVVQILPGQDRPAMPLPGAIYTEGTALLEILHDIAPGASLGFATAASSEASFAQNILDLRNVLNCDVIVDDVFWGSEPVFQDGIIAQAVDTVRASGALYFSSAGNSGNFNDGQSGVWEGSYVPATPPAVLTGRVLSVHDFGGGVTMNTITADPPFFIILQWDDPFGASANDYDLYLLDSTGTQIIDASVTLQTGAGEPIEAIGSDPFNDAGNKIVVGLFNGSPNRRLSVHTHRGRLAIATPGSIVGHPAATGAIAVAATNVANAGGGPFQGGSANPVEFFSSDGPRFISLTPNGTPIPGGTIREKPDLTGADGVATATPGPFNPFFGTSASAPHVAGIAALLWSGGQFSAGQVETALRNTAIDIEAPGRDRDSGHGIANAFAAGQALNQSSADLAAAWGKLRPSCDPGQCFIRGEFFVRNQGTLAAAASTARIYYSTNSQFDPNVDAPVVSVPIGALSAGAAQRRKLSVPLPAGVSDPAGAFLFAVADDGKAVAEGDETNNAAPFSFGGPTP